MSPVLKTKLSMLDPNRRLGTINAVYPNRALVNLSDEAARSGTNLYGHALGSGQVGEFVLISSNDQVLIGRMSAIRLVERDRLSINPALDERPRVDPIGEIDLLATVDRFTSKIIPGIEEQPRLGSAVYSPAPQLMSDLISESGTAAKKLVAVLSLGVASGVPNSRVCVSPERLFGRHCAVLGATGGGKSFTLAKLSEECHKLSGKVILFDATGEFYTLGDIADHISLGKPTHLERETHLPFSALDEQDLYGLFQPSGKVQGPKLREAILSLRVAHILANSSDATVFGYKALLAAEGMLSGNEIIKAFKKVKPFRDVMIGLRAQIQATQAPFDIYSLAEQIINECVWINGESYGKPDDQSLGWCTGLLARINAVLYGEELQVVFQSVGANILDEINKFIESDKSILRISLASIPHSFGAREIVANAMARRLLLDAKMRSSTRRKPIVVMLDEAHNFLSKRIGSEDAIVELDAFDRIAKEGRKHWLNLCLATQRPRDLPDGVLSQMGALIVHRLTNHGDRELVERACGDIDRAAVAFLPTLSPGQAAIVGADFPFPLTVAMDKPLRWPDSQGPDFQSTWAIRSLVN